MVALWMVLAWILGLLCWTEGKEVNIALLKNASTSLGYHLNFKPNRAVDGNIVTAEFTGDCFQGAGSPADWTVDLGQEYQLYGIRVYIRAAVLSRTANSIIYLDNNSSRVCYTFPSIISDNPTYLTCNGTARYVTIRNPGKAAGLEHSLNICEVEIYVCSTGTYGTKCTNSCGHCAFPTCDRWTGFCSGDCVAGYRGNRCDTACDSTTYGVNCREKCADRNCYTDNGSCDRVTGSCDTGCLPGWMGTDCIEECGRRYYGSSCSNLCVDRHCKGNSTCNHVTGSCDKGCEAGWKGTDCKQACDREHYGPDCTGLCSSRHCDGGSSCNPNTGQCDGGCQGGWTGADCTVCDREHYGPNCNRLCSSRHCDGGSSCSPTTGRCDGGCQGGWTGTDCSQELIQPPLGKPQTIVMVVSVTAVVVVIVILIIICVIIWRRRRNRSPTETEREQEQVSYKTAHHGVVIKGEVNENVSSSIESTYTTIDAADDGDQSNSQGDSDVIARANIKSESSMTYEKLKTGSRDRETEYTGLQTDRSYENLERKGFRN